MSGIISRRNSIMSSIRIFCFCATYCRMSFSREIVFFSVVYSFHIQVPPLWSWWIFLDVRIWKTSGSSIPHSLKRLLYSFSRSLFCKEVLFSKRIRSSRDCIDGSSCHLREYAVIKSVLSTSNWLEFSTIFMIISSTCLDSGLNFLRSSIIRFSFFNGLTQCPNKVKTTPHLLFRCFKSQSTTINWSLIRVLYPISPPKILAPIKCNIKFTTLSSVPYPKNIARDSFVGVLLQKSWMFWIAVRNSFETSYNSISHLSEAFRLLCSIHENDLYIGLRSVSNCSILALVLFLFTAIDLMSYPYW